MDREINGIKMYTLFEVAQKLHLTERTLHTYIKNKKIKSKLFKNGVKIKYTRVFCKITFHFIWYSHWI